MTDDMTDQDKNTEKDVLEDQEQAEENEALEHEEEGSNAAKIAELEKALEEAKAATEAQKDQYLRLYAEFDNFKKRSLRELKDFRKFANESLIRELLTVVDNLERAIASSEENQNGAEKCIIEGVEMTHKEILRILEKNNTTPVEAMGRPFDPNYHEAVGQEESSEHDNNTVVREFQKGYLLHDRLIRPAMVIVSKAPPAPADTREDDSDEGNLPEEENTRVTVKVTTSEDIKPETEPDVENEN
jgi:molecular chaperone GrpE